jgi:cytochrome o ubiquinol oxidase operon protein cyoD
MSKEKVIIGEHSPIQGSYKSYVIGFLLSLACTLIAYTLVTHNALSGKWALAILVAVLALIQFFTQMTLFLHLGHESKPKYKLLVFGFMVTVVLILVSGSIWIMYNLNYHMMTPSQINNYMSKQDGGI